MKFKNAKKYINFPVHDITKDVQAQFLSKKTQKTMNAIYQISWVKNTKK